MKRIEQIISAIDEFLTENHQDYTTPVEAGKYLESKGLLNDSHSRHGLPLRNLLRDGEINHAYQVGVNWRIPLSPASSKSKAMLSDSPKQDKKSKKVKTHKLYPIASLIVDMIQKKYKIKPDFTFEFKPDWLMSYTDVALIEKYPEIGKVYAGLVDNQFDLMETLSSVPEEKLSQKQSFDIWIGSPFNFAIEFDEIQHFNQFRLLTLEYYPNTKVGFPLSLYKKLNNGVVIKPASSGFTKLNSFDPLFPPLSDDKKQDNRIRQRAFRDYLKDILPVLNNFNPTIRIPYHVTNCKIKDFSEMDLKHVENYLMNNGLIDKLKMK